MLNINITIDDTTQTALLHNLNGNPGIINWVRDAILGKAHTCLHRANSGLLAEGLKILQADPKVLAIPKDELALIEAVVNHPAYLNREQREVEMNKLNQPKSEV